jgi:hypothetical protein
MNLGDAPSKQRASFPGCHSPLPYMHTYFYCIEYNADEFMTRYPSALKYVLHVTNKIM